MKILYQDSQIVVCVKPVGLDSQAEMPSALTELLGGSFLPVHRLDKNVGGVMVYARNKDAAGKLSSAIQAGTFIKEYIAAVHGTPPEASDWEDWLFKDSNKNKVFVVKKERKGVKKARLEFVRLNEGETSLVRIRLHTGRTHQIRVQFASRGYPLAGDHKYGARDDFSAPMLYSCKLTFPWKGKSLQFEDLPPWV